VNDAVRLAEVLHSQHGFEVHGPLLDATGAQLRELLQVTLKDEVGANDRVLFYFAGHGVAADGEDGPAGYIVPADAEKTELSTYIPMADLQAALDALPCRHLLLILDCCFSGAFKWSTQHRAITGLMPKRIYAQRFARFVEDPARQIITSAAYDQKALDVLAGKATGDRGGVAADDGRMHSPFALALFDALAGAADVKLDREGDGVITATETYAFIRDRIEPATIAERQRQTPSFFPLKGHGKGEFMFRNPHHRFNMPPMQGHSPFKGLASFDEADRHLFYGRDRVVAALAVKAADPAQRLLVVVGPSGTGKSSVIKAGLLPQLKDAGLAVVVMRPGAHPLAELAKALEGGSGPLVLIVDQFEELITRCADEAERQAFDVRLHDLLESHERVERIVITVRSDFEPQLSSGALKDAWRSGRFTVPPFSLDELRQVIVMPTIQEVMIFEPAELVDRIVEEVVQSPGALPLLSYTLNELFQAYVRRGGDKRDLTEADYEQLGGVMGALRTKADALHDELASDAEREVMRKVMLRMVSVEGELAGRRVPMSELVYAQADQAMVNTVVERLIDARLIVRNEGGVEPAHDALVRAWKRLRDWIHDAGRDNLIVGEQLQIAVADHARTGEDDYLWNTSPNLPVVQALLKDPQRGWFNAREAAFIAASVRRKNRRLRITVGAALAIFATVSALMVWGWIEQGHATDTITQARDFTDDMLGNLMKKLRAVEKTQDARKHLVTQVSGLHAKLAETVGAKDDPNTRFWTYVADGDVELDNTRYALAGRQYQLALDTATRQAATPYWQRNLSIAHGLLGDLARKTDKEQRKATDFAAARQHYRRALAIDEGLAAADAGDRIAQHDLLVSLFRLGDLERRDAQAGAQPGAPPRSEDDAAEHQREARRMYARALPIAERLVSQQAMDAEAQRDLVMVLLELGNVAFDLSADLKDEDGDLALAMYTRARQHAEQGHAAVRLHPAMQALLATGMGRLATVFSERGEWGAARESIRLAIESGGSPAEPAARDKAASAIRQQRERYANLETLGEIELRAGQFDAARSAYGEALKIAEREAASGPGDIDWQKDRFELLLKLAEMEVSAGSRQAGGAKLKGARLAFQRALSAARSAAERQLVASCVVTPRAPCK
jgi:tetratricopeptide (TPR) repeat protein